jgi:hypothetical protein
MTNDLARTGEFTHRPPTAVPDTRSPNPLTDTITPHPPL